MLLRYAGIRSLNVIMWALTGQLMLFTWSLANHLTVIFDYVDFVDFVLYYVLYYVLYLFSIFILYNNNIRS